MRLTRSRTTSTAGRRRLRHTAAVVVTALGLCLTLTAQSGGGGTTSEPTTEPVSKSEVKAWNKALNPDLKREDTDLTTTWQNRRRNAEGKRVTYTTMLVSIDGQQPAIGERTLKGWTSAVFELAAKPEPLTLTDASNRASVKITPVFKSKKAIWSVLVDDTNARYRSLHGTSKPGALGLYAAVGPEADRYSFIMIGPKDGSRPSLALHVLADASALCQGFLKAKVSGDLTKFRKGEIFLKVTPEVTYCDAFAAAALEAARGSAYEDYAKSYASRTANTVVGVRYIIFPEGTYRALASAARSGNIGPAGLDIPK